MYNSRKMNSSIFDVVIAGLAVGCAANLIHSFYLLYLVTGLLLLSLFFRKQDRISKFVLLGSLLVVFLLSFVSRPDMKSLFAVIIAMSVTYFYLRIRRIWF